MKKKELRDRRDADPAFVRQFGEWVYQGKFPDAKDVRHLPEILANDQAKKRFEKQGIREAQAILYNANPSLISNLYSIVDQAAHELENVSLVEVTALKDHDEARLEKLRRLVRAVRKLEEFSGVTLGGD
jgi:hypothetical protein